MADWGLYSALRGHDDWAQKRNDAAMALGIAQERENRSQIALQRQMQMEEGMQQAFDELARLDVLEQDAGRIKDLETEQRKRIVQGVAKYNGDLTKYMSSGGIRDLHNYKNSILQSEVYKKAISNKGNLQQYLKDRTDGKYIKSSVVEVPTTDEKTGKQVMRPMKLSFAQQMKLFQDGVIDQLNYGGAEDKVTIDPNKFQQVYKNSLNPYQADNLVSMSNIYEQAILSKAGEEQAQYLAQEYGDMVAKGMKPYTFKAGDINELRLKQQEAARKEEMHQARLAKLKGGGGSGGGGIEYTNVFGNRVQYLKPGDATHITSYEMNALLKEIGIRPIGKEKSYMGGQFKYDGDVLGPDLKKPISMNGEAEIISFPDKPLFKSPVDGKMYLIANAAFDDDNPAFTDPNSYWIDQIDPAFVDKNGKSLIKSGDWGSGRNNALYDWGDKSLTGQIYIPLENTLGDPQSLQILNSKINVKNNATMNAPDFSDQAQMQSFLSRDREIVEGIMRDHNMTYDEAVQALQNMSEE